ncbi:MAG: exodeoxyribonuclease III [Verrucomicrobia bacterium]|nr:exodeoxyribonuclease III [Verrucomicrobiota bacterium]MBI3867767.1 exodeoxyribonuclease III [Verrucomicrobiota bacterium]
MKLLSWNVNGIRAALNKGLGAFIEKQTPDIVCLQETKARQEQVTDLFFAQGYHQSWNSAVKPGYSGTAIFSKKKPRSVALGLGASQHDNEGRVITHEYDDFYLVNVYTPNSKRELERLDYRTKEWEPAFRAHLVALNRKKPVAVCGDLNVAHTEIDLANPKTNTRNAGFTMEERREFSRLLETGFIDTFREFEKGPGHYTWWSQQSAARSRNVGWRIDYFIISPQLRPALKTAFILPEVMGSDHCPVGVTLG